jgi:hypothetical protein
VNSKNITKGNWKENYQKNGEVPDTSNDNILMMDSIYGSGFKLIAIDHGIESEFEGTERPPRGDEYDME